MSADTATTTSDAHRAAVIASVIADQLAAMAAQIPEPALATPLGFFGEALGWAERALSSDDASSAGQPATADAGPASPPAADVARVEAYLQARFADPGATVTGVTVIGGGYSKYTILVTATVDRQEQELVLRQLPEGRPNDLTEEFGVIQQVWAPGLPVPEPLWLEPADNDLGGAFFATRRLPGANLGDVNGASGDVPAGFCGDLADFLAQLHRTEVGSISATPISHMRSAEEIRLAIDELADKAQARIGRLGADTTAVLDWLRDNVPSSSRPVVVVHGDVGLHNTLEDGGRLSAVLDWERSHLGDPVEDLAYLRPSLEPHYSWDAFVDRYVAAGGDAPDPDVERFYTVWQDTWRHVECSILAEDFLESRGVPMMIAGYVLGPKFLASAVRTAFGPREVAR